MPKLGKPITPEGSIIRGLVLDSKDLFSREAYEERIDKGLAELTYQFRKNRAVDANKVRKVVEEFIAVVERTLRELEDAKRRAVQEEYKKLDKIRGLLAEGKKINSEKLKKELEKFGQELKSNTLSVLRYNRRREKRLRREKAPFGFILKKLANDRYLDAEVARKAFRLGEHTLKEPQLFSGVDYLVSMLNQNPNKETLDQLKQRIHRLTKDYEGDLDDFLTVEVDIGLEEARKLHRIDHYITFLKMIERIGNFDDLIKRLESLKKFVNNWVYQDIINAKNLERYAIRSFEYGEKLLEASKANKFAGITAINLPISNIVPGILMYKSDQPFPNRGQHSYNSAVVLIHGLPGNKETQLGLGRILVSRGYVVYSIDMASSGESRENFRLGRNAEYIQEAVRYFRLNNVRHVGVIGHSAGAMSTLLALCGYDTRIENWFYNIVTRLIERLDEIAEDLSKKDLDDKTRAENRYKLTLQSKEYRVLKKVVLDGLKKMISGQSRIDAAILLAPPLTLQAAMPSPVINFLKKRRKKFIKIFGRSVTEFTNLLLLLGSRKLGQGYKYVAKGEEVQLMGLVIPDIYDFFSYIENVKNPYDFINIIDYLCDNVRNPDMDTEFFRYYRENIIRKTPKLFIYGLSDEFLKPLQNGNMPELEGHYRSVRAIDIIRYPNVSHTLIRESNLPVLEFEGNKLPKMVYKIVTFLDNYLGRGRLV